MNQNGLMVTFYIKIGKEGNMVKGHFRCEICGKDTRIHPGALSVWKKERCSKCYDSKRKSMRVKTFKKQKRNKHYIIINEQRDRLIAKGLWCDICKRHIAIHSFLHMHHKNRDVEDNSNENLQLLCVTCHAEQHRDCTSVHHLLLFHSRRMEQLLFGK